MPVCCGGCLLFCLLSPSLFRFSVRLYMYIDIHTPQGLRDEQPKEKVEPQNSRKNKKSVIIYIDNIKMTYYIMYIQRKE